MILSVDAGINACGCALFKEGQGFSQGAYVLHRAWLAKSDLRTEAASLERCVSMARAVVRGLSLEEVQGLIVFAGEWQQAYTRAKSKGNPNKSLLPLVGVLAAIAAQLPPSVELMQYLPHEWKGSIDADAFIERIKARLSPGEQTRIEACPPSLVHNVYDGIGIGLKYLGRLERHRVISRGKTT